MGYNLLYIKKFYNNKIIYLLLSILNIIFTSSFLLLKGNEILGFILYLYLSILLCIYLLRLNDKFLFFWIISVWNLRFIFSLINNYFFSLPDSTGDAILFEKFAWLNAKNWHAGLEGVRTSSSYLYSAFLGIFYYLFGRVELIGQLLNILMSIIIIILIYKIIIMITLNLKYARIGAFLVGVFPTSNLYSVLLLREMILIFLFTLSLYFFVKWFYTNKFIYFVLSVIFPLIAGPMHQGIPFAAIGYFIIYGLYNHKRNKYRTINFRLVISIILFSIIFMIAAPYLLYRIPGLDKLFSVGFFQNTVRGDAGYLANLVSTSYFDIMWQTPIRILYFYFSPFIWMTESATDLIGIIDGFLYLILFYYSIKSFKIIDHRSKELFKAFVIVLFIMSFVFSWQTSNYGTAIRHRHKILMLLIPFASIGIRNNLFHKLLTNIKIK